MSSRPRFEKNRIYQPLISRTIFSGLKFGPNRLFFYPKAPLMLKWSTRFWSSLGKRKEVLALDYRKLSRLRVPIWTFCSRTKASKSSLCWITTSRICLWPKIFVARLGCLMRVTLPLRGRFCKLVICMTLITVFLHQVISSTLVNFVIF